MSKMNAPQLHCLYRIISELKTRKNRLQHRHLIRVDFYTNRSAVFITRIYSTPDGNLGKHIFEFRGKPKARRTVRRRRNQNEGTIVLHLFSVFRLVLFPTDKKDSIKLPNQFQTNSTFRIQKINCRNSSQKCYSSRC